MNAVDVLITIMREIPTFYRIEKGNNERIYVLHQKQGQIPAYILDVRNGTIHIWGSGLDITPQRAIVRLELGDPKLKEKLAKYL